MLTLCSNNYAKNELHILRVSCLTRFKNLDFHLSHAQFAASVVQRVREEFTDNWDKSPEEEVDTDEQPEQREGGSS